MARARYTDEWMLVNGVRLHYQDWGERDAPPLLLLHGFTQQSHTFDAVAARLAGRFRCLALDVRGRGESDWAPEETYVLPQYVDDVARFLAALDLPAIHVLGTSMGGLIGLSLAAAAPGAVWSLGLNDIGPEIDSRGAARIGAYAAQVPESFVSFDAALAWALEVYVWFRSVPRATAVEAVRWAVREGPDGRWRLKFDPGIARAPRPTPEAMAQTSRLWWQALRALSGPVLLVRGAGSDVLAAETADEMQRVQPRLERVDVPGVGHAPLLTEPAAEAALDRFYGTLVAPPEVSRRR